MCLQWPPSLDEEAINGALGDFMRGKRARCSGGPRSLAEVDTRVGSEASWLSPSYIVSTSHVEALII